MSLVIVGILALMSASQHTTPQREEWHALTVAEVFEKQKTPEDGLTKEEVERRKSIYGKNVFSEGARRTLLDQFFAQFKNPLTLVLLAAAGITFALGDVVDGAVITLALLVAVVLGVFQEGRASRAFEKLASSQQHSALVLRGGKRHEIAAEELVVGDMVILQGGVQVPADLRLIEAKHLSVNEAPLTGEWLAVKKNTEEAPVGAPLAEQYSMAWKGTFVVDGYGVGIVIAIGDDTEVGQLSKELASVTESETPLQKEMKRISHLMFVVIAVLVILIFAVGLFRGESLATMLVTSIAIAVASIPEGLPAAVTIVLAVSMEALLRRGGLVRSLLAAETLGGATYVLTDKTGTLTEGRMAVTEVMYKGQEKKVLWQKDLYAQKLLDTALCASDAFLDEVENDEEAYVVRGESMERAILEAALEVGVTLQGESTRAQRTDFLSFSSENRFAAGVSKIGKTYRICINGAPEYLLEQATHIETPKGRIKLSPSVRREMTQTITELTKEGKRLIAISYKSAKEKMLPENSESIISGNTFFGLIVFNDPVRPDVADAIRDVQRAGAVVRLITGDNPETALSIARTVGIARPHDIALTGKDITERSDAELLELLKTVPVFARILPRQKMRIAQILQSSGEIVAMTGDGINDAPALQKAHIGVALGSGTEVAKEAADLVLVNDSFAILRAAIEEGRRIIQNLRKIIGCLLSTSLSEIVLIGGALIMGVPLPLVPAQILWANLVGEGLMSVAFAFEPADKNTMQQSPRDIHASGILTRETIGFIGVATLIFSGLLVALYVTLLSFAVPIEMIRSTMFLALALGALSITFSFRSLTIPFWQIPLRTNLFFALSFCINLVLLGVVITVPFLQRVFSYEPLPLPWLFGVLCFALVAMLCIEMAKWLFTLRRKGSF